MSNKIDHIFVIHVISKLIYLLPPNVQSTKPRKFIIDKGDKNITRPLVNPNDPNPDTAFLHYATYFLFRISTDHLVGYNVTSVNEIYRKELKF